MSLTAIALVSAVPWAAGASELPDTARSREVEIRIAWSSGPMVLRQDCEHGPYAKTIVVKGTGEAQLRVQIHHEPPCPPEVTDFEVSAGEYLEMLNGLVALRFDRLDREYSGREEFVVVGPGTLQRLVSVCSDCADSLTVGLEMGEYQHTVHWGDGAKVPGLSEWTSRWQAALVAKAELARLGSTE